MRMYWDSGLKIYESADEAARDIIKRGIEVTVTTRKSAVSTAEKQLNELLPWKRVAATDKAAQSVKERLAEFRRSPHH